VHDPDLSVAVIGLVLGIANVGWLLEALTAAQSTSAIRNLASLSATTIDA